MSLDLAALERLLAAATPGPWWSNVSQNPEEHKGWVYGSEDGSNIATTWWEGNPGHDAALIVAAVNALPSLIEAARREAGLRGTLALIADGRGPAREMAEAAISADEEEGT